MTDYIVFCIVGRVLIYALQKFPFGQFPLAGKLFIEGKLLKQLLDCDFCLGVWLFSFLAFAFKMNILSEWTYIPVLSEVITGTSVSFLVHLLRLGWQTKFGVIVME